MAVKVYKIIIDDPKAIFKDVLKEHELALSLQIVDAICTAVEEGISFVEIAKIITPTQNITLQSQEANYIETLKINMETLIEYEEYLPCARAQKTIEKLSKKFLHNKKIY